MNLELWKKIKKQKHLTIAEIAKRANLPKGSVQNIFAGYVPTPRIDTVEAIESALGINSTPTIKDEIEINDLYPIPLLGSVIAGMPIESQENTEGYVYISYRPKEEYFALRVHGESMKNAGIQDKSILICHKQETAENGDIIVAMVNKEQTVKRFKQIGSSIFLMPENPTFDPIPITKTDEFIILGKVVEVRFSV
ncbi:MAG: transcriptional repressor LexA [Candidatus Coproplasma sp.]